MGQYSKAIITVAGQSLIAKAIAGEAQLNITKAKTSDYKYPDDTDYKALTDMEGVKQVLELPETKVLRNDLIQTRVLFSNEEIKATYYIHNIGLYVNDGTKEVLFCIVTADIPDEMPQYNGVAATSYIYNIQNVVKDAETIHITVSTAGNATIQDVMDRVDGTGGDISETVIETLEPIDTKYPVPSAGESTKVFMGKVKKYIEDTKPLDEDMFVYVATTGSNTTGDGTSSKPYQTINYALSKIPRNLNGYSATVNMSAGLYAEDVTLSGFTEELKLVLAGDILINNLVVRGCKVACNSNDSSIMRTMTTQYIHVTKYGSLAVWNGVNILTNGYLQDQPYATRRCSICVSEGSVNIWGTVNIIGNTDIGVAVHSIADCFINNINTIAGTVLSLGTFIGAGSSVTYLKNNLSASALQWTDAGTVVSSYGAVIGTLRDNITLYVATTGSDSTGGGTSAEPFKTIQYAINTLPKDLGSKTATIIVEEGTYSENVVISGFYSGSLILHSTAGLALSDAHKINSITCSNNSARVYIYGFNLVTSVSDAFQGVCCVDIILRFITAKQSTISSGYTGFYFDACRARIESCLVANKTTGVSAYNSSVGSFIWSSASTGNTIGVLANINSIVNTTGIQPAATISQQTAGGMFVKENGTQVSGIISSGLSCTWANLSGGYIRHGNINGTAMVTIQISISLTTVLNIGETYVIYGFPKTLVDTGVCCHATDMFDRSHLSTNGNIYVRVKSGNAPGNILVFNCTYLTNS
jgi:hypothetical protein